MVEESKARDFETYLISALNDSILKKRKQLFDSLKCIRGDKVPAIRELVD